MLLVTPIAQEAFQARTQLGLIGLSLIRQSGTSKRKEYLQGFDSARRKGSDPLIHFHGSLALQPAPCLKRRAAALHGELLL